VLRKGRDQYFSQSPWVFSRAGKPILNFRKAWDAAREREQLEDLCTENGIPTDGTNASVREHLTKAGLIIPDDVPAKLFHDFRRTVCAT
jgi:hypothetical protein